MISITDAALSNIETGKSYPRITKLISNTIIPWTIEWLYFYELWLATGEWLGGGEHVDSGFSKTNIE